MCRSELVVLVKAAMKAGIIELEWFKCEIQDQHTQVPCCSSHSNLEALQDLQEHCLHQEYVQLRPRGRPFC